MSRADQAMLLMVRGVVASLPQEDQDKVKAAADQLRDVINQNGDAGVMALSLVAAEKAIEE